MRPKSGCVPAGDTYQHGFARHGVELRAEKQVGQDARGTDVGDGQTGLRQRRMLRVSGRLRIRPAAVSQHLR